MSGKFKSLSGTTLVLSHDNAADTTHNVANVTVTLNGAASNLAALQANDNVSLSGDPATSVTATR